MNAINDIDIGAMLQPISQENIFKVEGFHCWGPQITKGDDNNYYLTYSRWAKDGGHWLTTSEIGLAVSEKLEGPYRHLKIILKGRGEGYWDELMAHNPKLKRFGNRYYLYYISSRKAAGFKHIRYTQRIGVAVADSIKGPYMPSDAPIVKPAKPVYNITVNPGVTQMPDGRFLMMLKGDIEPRQSGAPMPRRVQGLALSDSPTGPFKILDELAIADIDTEDASIWHDEKRKKYFAVFHAHAYIGLIESDDGRNWRKAENYIVTKNVLKLDNGCLLKTVEPLQRPSVYIEAGEPRVLCLAVPEPGDWYCALVPLSC